MYVCVCKAVSDHRIRREVREHGACTLADLRQRLGVATQCGRCACEARALISTTLAEQGGVAALASRAPNPALAAA